MTSGREIFNPARQDAEASAAPILSSEIRRALGQAPESAPDAGGRAALEQDLPGPVLDREHPCLPYRDGFARFGLRVSGSHAPG